MWEIKKNLGTDPILKWEIVKKKKKKKKKVVNIKAVEKFCQLCMEEKLAIVS